jgi:heptaprenylglyceryl phosphate synthase
MYVRACSTTAQPLTMDAVRLQHLSLLLAAGGGSRDEEAEQMVSQVGAVCCVLCAVYSYAALK